MSDELNRARLALEKGRMSRRDFMWTATALGLAVPAATLMANKAAAQTPSRGGTLRVGFSTGSTTNQLDPVTYAEYFSYCLASAVCNYLVEIDAEKNPIPELATGWESSDNASHWVFELRNDVEFQNGKRFTAADVVYSLNRHRGEESTSAAKPFLAEITDIRADGDHTVVFDLSAGNADMPAILASYQLAIIPDGFDDFSTLIGTGAYELESYDPGVRFVGKRRSDYWKPDRAWVDTVEFLSILDSTARTNALLTGEVDMIERVDPKIVDRIRSRNGIQVIENEGVGYDSSAMDSRVAPFDNVDVRRALKYAVNRSELVDKVLRGTGTIGNDHPVPPNDPYFNAELEQRPYDPDKAKFHLKEAGYEDLAVRLHASDAAFPGAVDAAILFREHAAPAGIALEAVREPNDGYWSDVWMKEPFSMVTWSTRPTPAMTFSIGYACGAPWADGFLCHDRFEALLAEAKVVTEFDKRKEIFDEMQRILSEDGANHVFMFESAINAFAEKVGGARPDAYGPNLGQRPAERLWLNG